MIVILLVVNTVTVYVNWNLISRYRRYASRPFQIQQKFQIRLHDREETLGRIVIDGPALLILTSSGPLMIFALCDFDPTGTVAVRNTHGSREVEFLVHKTGRWSAKITARKFGWNMAKNRALCTITLEIRGHCNVL